MRDILNKILDSFDTSKKGFSGRKLTAFIIVLCVLSAHIKWISLGNFEQLEMVLTIDYGFLSVLFGLTTYSAIKQTSNDTTNNN